MHKTKIIFGAMTGSILSAVAYNYLSSDEFERACGVPNLFRTNYSDEIIKNIRMKVEDPDALIDFTALARWEMICVTSVYNEESEFYFMLDMDLSIMDQPKYSTWGGKSQCKGNVPGTV